MYRIIRHYERASVRTRVIETGLTLEEAQAHCKDPETSSRTCKLAHNKRRTKHVGAWFDGYTESK